MTQSAVSAVRKLKSRRGESLVETLVAILISVLAMALLASLIVIASKMTRESTESFNRYYDANNVITAPDDDDTPVGTGKVTLNKDGDTYYISEDHADITVKYYQNVEDESIISYQRVAG